MNGVLVIDKPAGPTSFEVVRQVRERLGAKKAGHTGTLDPLATGVLPICLGEATKVAGLITEGEKAYEAVVRLGQETDTQDASGKVLSVAPVPELSAERIEAVLASFRGSYLQRPPMYSAVKIGGKRLYQLAREGREVDRQARPVTVHELALNGFSAEELKLFVRCSKGFFVRVLAGEVGRSLGCGGHLRALRRTRSGPFTLDQAVPLDQLSSHPALRLVSLEEALSELPALTVSSKDAERVLHGVPLDAGPEKSNPVRVLSPEGRLLALADVERGRLKYRRVLAQ